MAPAPHLVANNGEPSLEPDLETARQFLDRLDPDAEGFTFATFTDAKGITKGRPDPLAQIRHGTLDDLASWLTQQNQLGAGIFVTVNETDGRGRKKENITRIRALWQEADRGDEPELPVVPHIVVESSPGKHHRYILVRGAVLEEFESVQQRLVDDYGSDPNAKDRSRVLRIPGFSHMKDPSTPHLVRLIDVSGVDPLAWGDVKAAFPPVVRESRPSTVPASEQPAPGTPLREPALIASALEALDPDMKYTDWLRIGMALHSTGAGLEAFSLWDTWSENGALYRAGECQYRWNTFDSDRQDPVALDTLYWYARNGGWDGQYGASNLVRHYVPIERERKLSEFNKRHGVVMVEGKDVIVYRETDQNVGRLVTRMADAGSMRNFCHTRHVPQLRRAGGDVVVERKGLFDNWLKWPTRRTYSQLVFRPVAELVAGDLNLPDEGVLNLYQGLSIEPKQGECSRMLKHIEEIWCDGNPEVYTYVLGWLARMFQRPNEQGHTVLLLQSGQGTGKNIIIDLLVRAFGDHAVVCTRTEDLAGRFNDHLATSVLVFANEALWGGDKAQEGALKALITDEELFTERKFVRKQRLRNCTHLIMASNNDWAAPIGLDDRRFVVLEVSEARKGDLEYFRALADEIKNGGTEALVWHLLHHDITSFDPRHLPRSGAQEAKLGAKIRGMSSVGQWLMDCLETGEILYRPGGFPMRVGNTDDWDIKAIEPSVQALYDSYTESAKERHRYLSPKSVFGKELKYFLGGKLQKTRVTATRENGVTTDTGAGLSGNREWRYQLPSLRDCRAEMEKLLGQTIDWPDMGVAEEPHSD